MRPLHINSKMRSIARILGIGAVCLGIAGYGLFQARGILQGPQIAIARPISGATATTSLIEIAGTASAVVSLTLNDRPIHTTVDGAFSEELLLSPGYNVMSVRARDRFGRVTEEMIEVIHTAPRLDTSLAP
jgi:hypothetical protein